MVKKAQRLFCGFCKVFFLIDIGLIFYGALFSMEIEGLLCYHTLQISCWNVECRHFVMFRYLNHLICPTSQSGVIARVMESSSFPAFYATYQLTKIIDWFVNLVGGLYWALNSLWMHKNAEKVGRPLELILLQLFHLIYMFENKLCCK